MNPVLVKIFATALALSQVTTNPDTVKTQFDPVADQAQVVQILQDGCSHIRKVFDIESINLDDLISTAMDDPQAMTANIKALNGVSFEDLFSAYKQFCKKETVAKSPIDLPEVITYFDKAAADLPDYNKLKDMRLPGLSVMLDAKGGRLAELGETGRRRIWVPLTDIPDNVQKAFVAAEDKRFYQHHGVDERGMIRAFVGNLAKSGRQSGGSTITQQVVKNLLTGDDATYERKIREIILASRVEHALSKPEILSLYLNFIYLGRGSWGVEMASQSYFGKSVHDLTLSEAAMLAGLTKGPSYFSPDRHPDRARERQNYVLTRMQEDGMISADDGKSALASSPQFVAYDPTRRDTGFYFADEVVREAKSVAGIDALASQDYTVHATVQPELQRATEAALQDGLARYEISTGRARFQGAEANLAEAIQHIESDRTSTGSIPVAPTPVPPVPPKTSATNSMTIPPRPGAPASSAIAAKPLAAPPPQQPQQMPAWQQALERTREPLYDVHWPTAVIISVPGNKSPGYRVGLRDGRVLPLSVDIASARRDLKLYDLVFVKVVEGKTAKAELRVRPQVQGAAMVLDNKTGKVLAMAGGFSYPLSQLNRVTQSRRQPGSTMKPVSYLAALEAGLQPNTLVRDEPITLPPIGNPVNAREADYWSPKNYEGGGSGVLTLRRALENSRNLVTAHLLDGAIAASPEDSLDRVCQLAQEAQLYKDCERYYPFILGAQPVRMIDLAAFFAAISNEGSRPTPYVIDSIEKDGKTIYHHDPQTALVGNANPAAFYQLKTMLQGVLARGTAYQIHQFAPYVGGKTGTTENENDAWFVGFSNDVTVAVWVGYDNADGQRRTLGAGETGAKAATPIFEPIMQAVWANYAPRAPLAGPSVEARRNLVDWPIDLASGDRLEQGIPGGFVEHFRRDRGGDFDDTQYKLVSREEAETYREADAQGQDEYAPAYGSPYPPGSSYYESDRGNYNPGYNGDRYGSGYNGDRYGPGYNGDRRYGNGLPNNPPPQQPARPPGGLFGFFFGQGQNGDQFGGNYDGPPRPRRVDPDYPVQNRGLY